ncbi:MAG: 6-pyruvoyl-tetrahydropterin synthase-related protein [Candidatus Acidiferrales bacterium]
MPVKIVKETQPWRTMIGRRGWVRPLVVVALAATGVIVPMWVFGDASGHDFQFHVASWVEMVRQWHEGILFPRWAEWANWGYGEPRFIFYPPASRIIGAAFGLVLPWRTVASAYTWLVLVGSGMAMWALARALLSKNEAVAAAIFFAVNPYSLVLVYYRSDFAELLAVALFPLLILAVLRIMQAGWAQVPFLALVFAAVWMCDAPAAVVATYSTVLLLAVSYALQGKRTTLLSGAAGMACGFGLAAFYVLPAAYEQRWANLGFTIHGNYQFVQNFLFSRTGDPDFRLFNLRISTIALGMILVCALLALFVTRKPDIRILSWLLVVLGGASVFMMVWPSAFLWHLLPEMKFVQFPWRWLDAIAPIFALFAAAACGSWRKRSIVWTCIVVVIAGTGIAIARTTWWDSDSANDIATWVRWGVGYDGTDEFAPPGSDRYALYAINPTLEQPPANSIPITTEFNTASNTLVPATDVRIHVEDWTAERRVLTEESMRPVNLAFRLFTYPAWRVRLDGQYVTTRTTPAGTMWLRMPAGRHGIDLTFRRTWDRTVGAAISLIAAILLLAWAVRKRFALPESKTRCFYSSAITENRSKRPGSVK